MRPVLLGSRPFTARSAQSERWELLAALLIFAFPHGTVYAEFVWDGVLVPSSGRPLL